MSKPTIVIDGVFFSLWHTGIRRLWDAYLTRWAKSEFGKHLVIVDREKTAPRYPELHYIDAPSYNAENDEQDRTLLQTICEQCNADLFCSTYYTTPLTTPSVMMVYDMIPEVTKTIDENPTWRDKHRAIRQAIAYSCLSESTRNDLQRFFPETSGRPSVVNYLGIDTSHFKPAPVGLLKSLHQQLALKKPYFLLVGPRPDYKNPYLFFEAMASLPSQHGFCALLTGDCYQESMVGSAKVACDIRSVRLDDRGLLAAYTGALALVVPSLHEGFGLTLLEAMACRCPVISTPFGSLQEVGGDAALYASTSQEMAAALCEVQKPAARRELIVRGQRNLERFSWDQSAAKLAGFFFEQYERLSP